MGFCASWGHSLFGFLFVPWNYIDQYRCSKVHFKGLSFCLQRILMVLPFELQAKAHRPHVLTPSCSPSALILFAEQMNNRSAYISAWGRRTTSSLRELSALAGSPNRGLRLPQVIYIGCVFIGSSESEPTIVHQLRADTHHMPSRFNTLYYHP